MLWTMMAVLLVLWLLGMTAGYVFNGMLHLMLVIAVVMLVLQLGSARRAV